MELIKEVKDERAPEISRQDLIDRLWEEFMSHLSARKLTYLDEDERSYLRGVCDGLERALRLVDPSAKEYPDPLNDSEIPF